MAVYQRVRDTFEILTTRGWEHVGQLQPEIRATDELIEDARSGSGPFAMTIAEIMAMQVEMSFTGTYVHPGEVPSMICGRPIETLSTRPVQAWPPCGFCGEPLNRNAYTCPICTAPTASWWIALDQMIAKWKRGG